MHNLTMPIHPFCHHTVPSPILFLQPVTCIRKWYVFIIYKQCSVFLSFFDSAALRVSFFRDRSQTAWQKLWVEQIFLIRFIPSVGRKHKFYIFTPKKTKPAVSQPYLSTMRPSASFFRKPTYLKCRAVWERSFRLNTLSLLFMWGLCNFLLLLSTQLK